MDPKNSRYIPPRLLFPTISIVVVFAIFIGTLWTSSSRQRVDGTLTVAASLQQCVEKRMSLLKLSSVDIGLIDSMSIGCYSELRNEYLLNDFYIRRNKFYDQSRDGHVLLWVVVVITLSGVALSALQLLISYKLAATGRPTAELGSEINLERERVSLKSSVTGLFILLFSFAFFALFVEKVYKITELSAGIPPPAAMEPTPQQLETSEIIHIPASPSAASAVKAVKK